MPGTKPMGPGVLYAKKETTPFTFQAFAATDAIRHLGVPQIGDSTRERLELNVSRGDRGRFHESMGRYNDVEFTIEVPLWGVGGTNPGDAHAARQAIMESGAGLAVSTVSETSRTFESNKAAPNKTFSAYYVDREAVLGQYLIGCIIQSVGLEFAKDSADGVKMVFAGVAARKVEAYKTALAVAIDSADATAMTISPNAIRDGSDAAAKTGLEVYYKIGDEIVKVTAHNGSTGVCTIARNQFGTSATTHLINAVVTPYAEAPTYQEAGVIAGPHDWTFNDGSAARNLRSLSYTLETGRAFDMLSSGQSASAALHNKMLNGTGSLSFILDNTRNDFFNWLDLGTDKDGAITVGSTAKSIFTITLGNMHFIEPVPKGLAENDIAEVTMSFRTRDTATALKPQLKIVET